MLNHFTSLIIISFYVYIALTESDYNENLLPFVKRKFHRIEDGNDFESRMFESVNKSCVLNILDLTDDNEDYLNQTGEFLNLRNEAINKAFEFCTENHQFTITQQQMLKNLKNHKSENYSDKIECFQLDLANLEPDSELLKYSNLIFNKTICDEILDDFEVKLMKGFNDYKNKITKNFNLQICDLSKMMEIGRKIALRYVVMANGNYAINDLMGMRKSFTDDAKEIMEKLIECYVIEMKRGNYGK